MRKLIFLALDDESFYGPDGEEIPPSAFFYIVSNTYRGIIIASDSEDFRQFLKKKRIKTYYKVIPFNRYLRMSKNKEENIENFKKLVQVLMDYGIFQGDVSCEFKEMFYVENVLINSLLQGEKGLLEVQADDEIVEGAYYGGRNEVFQKEAKFAINVDINSAYAWALTQDLPDPSPFRVLEKNVSLLSLSKLTDSYFIIVDGVFRTKNIKLPSIPMKYKGEDGISNIYYPPVLNDERVVAPVEDLLLAEENIVDYKINTVYFFKKRPRPFLKKLIDFLYDKRKKAEDEIKKNFLKLQIVKLYGRLADRRTYLPRNRALGAYVTSLVRQKLYKAIERVNKHYDVLYVDTDCLVVKTKDVEGVSNLLRFSSNLGDFSLREEMSDVYFIGQKKYIYKKNNEPVVKFSGKTLISPTINLRERRFEIIKPFTKTLEYVFW